MSCFYTFRLTLQDNSKSGTGGARVGSAEAGYGEEDIQKHLKQAIVQYHNSQDMTLATKQQFIASDTQIKSHTHHHFFTPHRSKEVPGIAATHAAGKTGAEMLRISHPEPLMSNPGVVSSNTTMDKDDKKNAMSVSTHRDPLPNKTKTKLATTCPEKLPPIFSLVSPRRAKNTGAKGGGDHMWLGPPNSIPPNKRNEHIAAYKVISTRIKSGEKRGNRTSHSWTELQQAQRASKEICDTPSVPTGPSILKNTSNLNDRPDENDSTLSYPYCENTDMHSLTTDSTFRNLRIIDMDTHYHSSRASQLSHTRSLPDLDHGSSLHYPESNFGNLSTKVGLPSNEQTYLEDMSSFSSNSQRRKKSVHFAPDVREITRENRTQPLSSSKGNGTNPVAVNVPMKYTSGSSESVNQLPVVLEKFTIKNLPVLPDISSTPSSSTSAINVNANVIYIKHDGEMQPSASSSTSTSAGRRNVHHQAREGTYSPHTYETLTKNLNKLAVSGSRPAEATIVESGISPRHVKVSLPTTSSENFESSKSATNDSSTATSTMPTTPSPSQPNSNRVSQNKKSNNPPKKAAYSTTKKVSVNKPKPANQNTNSHQNHSKKAKKNNVSNNSTRTGSETSSHNSTNSSSPINDPDDPDQRLRDYAQAMLAVQARMREFDTKFGSPNTIAMPKEDQVRFGKVVVPSATQTKDSKHCKNNKPP